MAERNYKDAITGSTDKFGKIIADGTINVGDMPGHYEHSAERFRLDVDGTRQLLEYNTVSQFTQNDDHIVLSPAAGETVTYRTRELFRYIINYDAIASAAFNANQALEGDDEVSFDLVDPTGNEIIRLLFTADDTKLQLIRGGTVQKAKSVSPERGVQAWARRAWIFNWYNVGPATLEETYLDSEDQQQNEEVDTIGIQNGRGPASGNFHIQLRVKADATTTGLQLEVGSVVYIVRGNVTETGREKVGRIPDVTAGSTGDYEPLFALRIDPDRKNVMCWMTDIVHATETDDDSEVLAIAVDSSKTNANFADPDNDGTEEGAASLPQMSDQNSVIQYTRDVTQIPDSTGSTTTSSADPGGRQVGLDAQQVTKKSPAGGAIQSSRPFFHDDIIVVCGKNDDSSDVVFNTLFKTLQLF